MRHLFNGSYFLHTVIHFSKLGWPESLFLKGLTKGRWSEKTESAKLTMNLRMNRN